MPTGTQTCLAALGAGWSRPTLKEIHAHVALEDTLLVPGGWGMIADGRMIYRTDTRYEVQQAFREWTHSGVVVCYTDGSGTTSDKPAGIGVAVYREDLEPQLIAQNIGKNTNNAAELTAIWVALRAVRSLDQRVMIKSDSEYAIGALTRDWARNSNQDLIANIRQDLSYRPNVQFEHVDGHEGHEGNEVADRLANIGRKLVTKVSIY